MQTSEIEERTVSVLFCESVEGNSLYIDDFRVCGSKPWGGGKTLNHWKKVPLKDVLKAIGLDNLLSLERRLAEAEYEQSRAENRYPTIVEYENLRDECERLEARVKELDGVLKRIIDECTIYTQDEKTTERIKVIAKQAIKKPNTVIEDRSDTITFKEQHGLTEKHENNEASF